MMKLPPVHVQIKEGTYSIWNAEQRRRAAKIGISPVIFQDRPAAEGEATILISKTGRRIKRGHEKRYAAKYNQQNNSKT